MAWFNKKGDGKQNESMDYDFECINLTDYELKITAKVKGSLLDRLYAAARTATIRKKNVKLPLQVDLKEFDIPPQFLQLLQVALKNALSSIDSDLVKDNIHTMTSRVSSGKFVKKDDGNWNVTVVITGQYADKR